MKAWVIKKNGKYVGGNGWTRKLKYADQYTKKEAIGAAYPGDDIVQIEIIYREIEK